MRCPPGCAPNKKANKKKPKGKKGKSPKAKRSSGGGGGGKQYPFRSCASYSTGADVCVCVSSPDEAKAAVDKLLNEAVKRGETWGMPVSLYDKRGCS